jgi:hypothetical protein
VGNDVESNGDKHDDLTSPFMPSNNNERHKRFIEDLAKEFTAKKGNLTAL